MCMLHRECDPAGHCTRVAPQMLMLVAATSRSHCPEPGCISSWLNRQHASTQTRFRQLLIVFLHYLPCITMICSSSELISFEHCTRHAERFFRGVHLPIHALYQAGTVGPLPSTLPLIRQLQEGLALSEMALAPRLTADVVSTTRGRESRMRPLSDSAEKPANTTECTAPMRAHASCAPMPKGVNTLAPVGWPACTIGCARRRARTTAACRSCRVRLGMIPFDIRV